MKVAASRFLPARIITEGPSGEQRGHPVKGLGWRGIPLCAPVRCLPLLPLPGPSLGRAYRNRGRHLRVKNMHKTLHQAILYGGLCLSGRTALLTLRACKTLPSVSLGAHSPSEGAKEHVSPAAPNLALKMTSFFCEGIKRAMTS